jgi:hypothetical protein
MSPLLTRRRFLAGAGAAGMGYFLAKPPGFAKHADASKALVAVTLDLEMSRNFPKWDDTHWDYEKGNLNDETKKYTVQACRRVKAAGGVLHCFAVGRTFEQESVAWLQEIAQAGHPIGNHTYDHVNVLATRPEDIQFRFQRAPWLIDGQEPLDVIRENVRLTTVALRTRIGVNPAGFRTRAASPTAWPTGPTCSGCSATRASPGSAASTPPTRWARPARSRPRPFSTASSGRRPRRSR